MSTADDFRFKSHELLLEIDAANTKMMMLVSGGELTGERWCLSVKRHSDAYEAWYLHINEVPLPSDSALLLEN